MPLRALAALAVALVLATTLTNPTAVSGVTSVTLVATIHTGAGSAWTPDSPDPSGLAYVPATETDIPAERRDRLVSADGEVEEPTGAGWHNVNVWFAPRNGAAQTATLNATAVTPTNKEPVGAAYDPVRNELYLSRDGTGSRVWVHDAATGALLRYFDVGVAPYFNADAEGLAFSNGVLYMVDALDNTASTDPATNGNDLVKVLPGPDGVIGATVTGNDDVVSNYDLGQFGQREPEGLDVHPVTGNIWVVSNRVTSAGVPDPMIEVTPNGALVSSVSIAPASPHSVGGLAIAPASNGSGAWNIYVADRGVDNYADALENDGRIYEFAINGGPLATPTPTPVATPTPAPTSLATPTPTPVATPTPTPVATPTPTPVATPTPTPVGGSNLLENAGFELDANTDGKPDSWTSSAYFTRSSGGQSGTNAGRWSSTSNNGPSSYQQVQVTEGTAYTVGGWVNAPATSDSFTFQVKILWRNASGAISSTVVKKFTDDTAGGWQQFTATAVAPAGATTARVQMVAGSLATTIYVDNFSFTQK